MHIATVKGNHLAAALHKVLKVRGTSAVNPTLECVHCKTAKNGLVLTTTNLTTSITTGIPAEIKQPGKVFLIPYKVQAILQQLKEVDIEIHNGDDLSFKYDDNVIKVPAEDPAEFPAPVTFKEAVSFKMDDVDAFMDHLTTHLKFTGRDELKPALTGVQLTPKSLASSDSNRICYTAFEALCEEPFNVVLRKDFIAALSAVTGEVTFKIHESYVSVNDKKTLIVSTPIGSEFPEADKAIEKMKKDIVMLISVDRLELVRNIKLALNLAESSKKITLSFLKDSYKVLGHDEEVTESIILKGTSEITRDDTEGGKMLVKYNGAHLVQQLELLTGEKVEFQLTVKGAALFHEADDSYLLMPKK